MHPVSRVWRIGLSGRTVTGNQHCISGDSGPPPQTASVGRRQWQRSPGQSRGEGRLRERRPPGLPLTSAAGRCCGGAAAGRGAQMGPRADRTRCQRLPGRGGSRDHSLGRGSARPGPAHPVPRTPHPPLPPPPPQGPPHGRAAAGGRRRWRTGGAAQPEGGGGGGRQWGAAGGLRAPGGRGAGWACAAAAGGARSRSAPAPPARTLSGRGGGTAPRRPVPMRGGRGTPGAPPPPRWKLPLAAGPTRGWSPRRGGAERSGVSPAWGGASSSLVFPTLEGQKRIILLPGFKLPRPALQDAHPARRGGRAGEWPPGAGWRWLGVGGTRRRAGAAPTGSAGTGRQRRRHLLAGLFPPPPSSYPPVLRLPPPCPRRRWEGTDSRPGGRRRGPGCWGRWRPPTCSPGRAMTPLPGRCRAGRVLGYHRATASAPPLPSALSALRPLPSFCTHCALLLSSPSEATALFPSPSCPPAPLHIP